MKLTTDNIRDYYAWSDGDLGGSDSIDEDSLKGFDEWFAEEIRAAKEEAWDQLYSSQFDGMPTWNGNTIHDPNNPYRPNNGEK